MPKFRFDTHKNPKPFNPHELVGKIVLYGLAADDGLRFLNWLVRSLINELMK